VTIQIHVPIIELGDRKQRTQEFALNGVGAVVITMSLQLTPEVHAMPKVSFFLFCSVLFCSFFLFLYIIIFFCIFLTASQSGRRPTLAPTPSCTTTSHLPIGTERFSWDLVLSFVFRFLFGFGFSFGLG
jgi:hypothetical protein